MQPVPPFPKPDPIVEPLNTTFDLTYTWDYETTRKELKHLYEQAKVNQWNVSREIDWSIDVDPEAELYPDEQIPIYGTHLWKKMTPVEIKRLRREQIAWSLSQFMHGEQGALLATAQLVDATRDFDSKLYASTQVMDEARHVEVFDKYLHEKVQLQYPITPPLKGMLDMILTDPRWDMKYLGMQIMVEGLALAAFHFMRDFSSETLMKSILDYVIKDEARHVAFGVLALRRVYTEEMNEKELREREEFVYESSVLMRDRLIAGQVFQRMGMPLEECIGYIKASQAHAEFRKILFTKIVPNVKKLGLLTPWLRERFAELDVLKYEDWEPTIAVPDQMAVAQ
ncbi:MAG: ferritin-like domain-containing protein [Candidatus Methylomirabilis sp.]|nr:ferritin-like domain-containing protein [Deltaproteobacteria bacterium]